MAWRPSVDPEGADNLWRGQFPFDLVWLVADGLALRRVEVTGSNSGGHGLPVSGCGAVLVDESAAGGVALDRLGRTDHSNVCGCRCSLTERAVRPMFVVMLHVLPQQRPELTFVPDVVRSSSS